MFENLKLDIIQAFIQCSCFEISYINSNTAQLRLVIKSPYILVIFQIH